MDRKQLKITDDLKNSALKFINEIKENDSNFIFPVVGDFIVDKYRWCKVERKNLEHDSLIYDLVDSSCYFGGAANVANIIGTFSMSSVNKSVIFYLGCGKDDPSYLKRVMLLNPDTFSVKMYVDSSYCRVVPVKTRYIGINRNEYLCRVDSEPTRQQFPKISDCIAANIANDINLIDSNVIFISDYNKGSISEELLEFISRDTKIKYSYCNIRPKKITKYIGKMSMLSFNKTEFIQTHQIIFGSNPNMDMISLESIHKLQNELDVEQMIITFGSSGFIYCGKNECYEVQSPKNLSTGSKNIIGAGDMVSASFAFFDYMNFNIFQKKYKKSVILYLVNCCAFLKVYTGEYTVPFDLLKSYISGKLMLF